MANLRVKSGISLTHRISAAAFVPVFGGATAGSEQRYPVISFANGADGQATCLIPADTAQWETFTVDFAWTNLGAGSGNVAWQLVMEGPAGGQSITSGGTTTTPAIVVPAPVKDAVRVDSAGTSTAPYTMPTGVLARLSFTRLGSSNASDTLGNAIGLLGVRLNRVR